MKGVLVVVGATGGVGRGIVFAALEAGFKVAAVAPEPTKLSELAADVGDARQLILVPGSIDSETHGAQLATSLRAIRQRFAGVVIAVNAPLGSARLIERTPAQLARTFEQNTLTHLVAARHLLPLLAQTRTGALFLSIGGGAADYPWAGYGDVSVAAAALKMLVRALADESAGGPVRVQLLQIDGIVRTHKNQACACSDWPSALEIGQRVVSLLQHPEVGTPIVHFTPGRSPARAASPPNPEST